MISRSWHGRGANDVNQGILQIEITLGSISTTGRFDAKVGSGLSVQASGDINSWLVVKIDNIGKAHVCCAFGRYVLYNGAHLEFWGYKKSLYRAHIQERTIAVTLLKITVYHFRINHILTLNSSLHLEFLLIMNCPNADIPNYHWYKI